MSGRYQHPSSSAAGPRAWMHPLGGPGKERFTLPFAGLLAAGLAAVGLAAAASWVDWRWVLVALCAIAVVLPCGLLVLRGRLDVFEPLTWFAVTFLLLFVLRPAYDLWHENFIYTGRLISPTFTKMLGLRDRLPDPGGRGARSAASTAPEGRLPPPSDLVLPGVRGRPGGVRGLLRSRARVA